MQKLLSCVSAHDHKDTPRTIQERPHAKKMKGSSNTASPERLPPRPPQNVQTAGHRRRSDSVPQQGPSPGGAQNVQQATFRRPSDPVISPGPPHGPREKRSSSSGQDYRPRASTDRQAGQEDTEIQILLIGKTGNGKSSTGNAILARSKPPFEVSTGIISATEHTQLAESGTSRGNLKIQVVDFPDVTSDMSEEAAQKEVQLCTTLTYPYPSATCLVVRADVRFTPEEYASYQKTRKLLGDRMFDNMVVVFTMGDKLPAEDRANFNEQLERANTELKQVIQDAKGRYVILSNGADSNSPLDNHRVEITDAQTGVAKLLDIAVNLHNINLTALRSKTLRVVLLGSRGSGKSATGNSIVYTNPVFEVHTGFANVSKSCDGTSIRLRGFELEVVDTPGISPKEAGQSNRLPKDVQKWFSKLDQGPDVLLFVTKANERFRDEDEEVLGALQHAIGEDFNKHVIVVFTGGDELTRKRKTIERELQAAPESLKNLLRDVNNRYVVFDNETKSVTEKLLQRNRLLQKMASLKDANRGKPLKISKKVPAERSSPQTGGRYVKKESNDRPTERSQSPPQSEGRYARKGSYEMATGESEVRDHPPQSSQSNHWINKCAIS